MSAKSSSNYPTLACPLAKPFHPTWTAVAPPIYELWFVILFLLLFLRLIFTLSFTECRNNVAPVYKPRAADVWSLGIVLINMYVLYIPFATIYLFFFWLRDLRSYKM